MKAIQALRPFRGPPPKRVLADHLVEPEYSIPTDDQFTCDLDDDIRALKYDPRIHVEGVRQWVNKTRPVRQPFEGEPAGAASESLPVRCDSAPSVSAADTDSLEEEWRRREFERAFAQLAHQHELRAGDPAKAEARRLAERVARYKRAFLRGFYEARIRRVEANRCLYERLHVNADHIREKYRRLMEASEPLYVAEEGAAVAQDAAPVAPDAGPDAEATEERGEADARSCERADELEALDEAASVYSVAPERDHVLLQDADAAPQVRGFGRDWRSKYDPRLRLLHLEGWVAPDIERWMEERKLQAAAESTEAGSEYRHPRYDDEEAKAPKEDLRYEEIRGGTELPTWLGPKKLDEQEMERKASADEERRSAAPEAEERQDEEERADAGSQASVAGSAMPSRGLLRQLVQSSGKEYYKLWYATHDTYNTTPFLEARLQRLMREMMGRREWAQYRESLKERQLEKSRRVAREMGLQQP